MKQTTQYPIVKTAFLVDGETYAIEGAGQETVKTALKEWKGKIVKLKGFITTASTGKEQFIPVDLN